MNHKLDMKPDLAPHPHWDGYLDGTLSAEELAEFNRFLEADPQAAKRLESEQGWLNELGAGGVQTDSDSAFRDAVLERWNSPQSNPAYNTAVIARIGFGVAAAAAVALTAVFYLVNPTRSGNSTPVAATRPLVVEARTSDPLSVLLSDVNEQIESQPRRIRSAIDQTASLFTFDRLAEMIELDEFTPGPAATPTDSDPVELPES